MNRLLRRVSGPSWIHTGVVVGVTALLLTAYALSPNSPARTVHGHNYVGRAALMLASATPTAVATAPHRAAREAVPDVLMRQGNNGVVEPTAWCRANRDTCTTALTNRWFADRNSPDATAQALTNMRRVFMNEWDRNHSGTTKAKRQTALQAWTHYRDGLTGPGQLCAMTVKAGNQGVEPGAPAYPLCRARLWGGGDGIDLNVNFNNIDKGWLTCQETVLGTAGVAFSRDDPNPFRIGLGAPVAVVILEDGTKVCAGVFAVNHFLF